MKYGDKFVLCINEQLCDNKKQFYLHSEPISQWSSANVARAQQVMFHNKKDANAVWIFEYADTSMRLEYEKTENVKIDDIVIIQHCYTKQPLACDNESQGTDFGNEYELVCSLYHPKGRISTMNNELEGLVGDSRQQLTQNQWKLLDSSCFSKKE